MNATCPAGISQPQRVSDLGRLLDSEITAPLDSTPAGVVHPPAWRLPLCMAPQPAWRLLLCMAPPSAWRLPLYKAPSSMARALCKAPLPLAPALCKAPSPRHVRGGALHPTPETPYLKILSVDFSLTFSITSQLPHERGVPKETLLPSSSRSCEPPLSTPSGLRLGSGSTRPTTRAARLVRHRRHAQRDPFGTKDQATHEHTADSALSASCSASTSRPLHFVLSTVGIGPHSHLAECCETSKDGRPGRPESPLQSTALYDPYFPRATTRTQGTVYNNPGTIGDDCIDTPHTTRTHKT